MKDNLLIIDVRKPEEFAEGHIDGAINLPPAELLAGAKKLDGVDKNTHLVLYCRSGARSNAAMHILGGLGFTNLENGINQGHVEKRYLS